jgi:tetratricopeptide (TPR) repeat protein
VTRSPAMVAVLSSLLLLAPRAARCDTASSVGSGAHVSASFGCDELMGFAGALREEGDYYRAITEYKRVAHFCSDDTLKQRARMAVGEVLLEAGRYGLVVDWYRGLGTEEARVPSAELLTGRSLFRLGQYEDTIGLLTPLSRNGASEEQASEASYYVGLSQIRVGRLQKAEDSLSLVDHASPYSDRASRYLHLLESRPEPDNKSPFVASVLAVVPGAGYAYSGHYGTALASLVVNGLLGWATADAFRDGNDGAGGFYLLLTAGFYLGNIMGSAQSATRYNAHQEARFQAMFGE